MCTLEKNPKKCNNGGPGCCETCGWNPNEIERRQRIRETYGLSTGSDGLKRLVIGGEAGNEPSILEVKCMT